MTHLAPRTTTAANAVAVARYRSVILNLLYAKLVATMTENEIQLDTEAQALFAELDGLEESNKGRSAAEMMVLSLAEEQKQQDVWRILLCEIVHLLAGYFQRLDLCDGEAEERQAFEQLAGSLAKISQLPKHTGRILVRYRGFSRGGDVPQKVDYEILFGNILVDLEVIPKMIRRHGNLLAHLMGQLMDAFGIFAERGINNLHLNLPTGDPGALDRLRRSLHIVGRLYRAHANQRDIVLGSGKMNVVPIVTDENGAVSTNLTLMAGINRLGAPAMRDLVTKVGAWMQKKEASEEGCRYTSVYNAIFGMPTISAQLIAPPVEINNLDWLLREASEKQFTREKAKVGRIIASAEHSPEKIAKVIKSVYGDDYQHINATHLEERLGLSSHLLQTIDSRPRSDDARQEVLNSLQKRLDTVRDDVFDDLHVSGAEQGSVGGGGTILAMVHRQLFRMVTFFKGRSSTRKKMTAMVHTVIQFEEGDYEILCQDFDIQMEDARQLVDALKKCFNQQGRFLKSGFAGALPLFSRYEKKIFEFLWRNLKDVVTSEDRIAFLNALQMLTARMKQPKQAFTVLLEDFLKDPEDIQFSDAKALMLANLTLHRYDKSLADIEITPEDILFNYRSLDQEVASYAAWRMDRDQEAFFSKARTIHQGLCEALEFGMTRRHRLSVKDLLSLERELLIFFSMIETVVGCSVLRSAVNEYGSPESDLYFLKKSDSCLSGLLQNLRITIRGLANFGGMEAIPALEGVKTREAVFARLKKTKAHQDQVRLISEWVDEAVKIIRFRS